MIINTNLEMFAYLQTVNDIALEYFSPEGKHQPHIGMVNAMRVFYNLCVEKSKFDEKYGHNVDDAEDMKVIVADIDFIEAFNDSINADKVGFNFANAYRQALDIVEQKKSSLDNTIDVIYNAVLNLIDSFNASIDKDMINAMLDVANKMEDNKINAETIVEAYANSQRFKDVIKNEEKEE